MTKNITTARLNAERLNINLKESVRKMGAPLEHQVRVAFLAQKYPRFIGLPLHAGVGRCTVIYGSVFICECAS